MDPSVHYLELFRKITASTFVELVEKFCEEAVRFQNPAPRQAWVALAEKVKGFTGPTGISEVAESKVEEKLDLILDVVGQIKVASHGPDLPGLPPLGEPAVEVKKRGRRS
jgi:hypothetical protein